jgi:hypothetical protein
MYLKFAWMCNIAVAQREKRYIFQGEKGEFCRCGLMPVCSCFWAEHKQFLIKEVLVGTTLITVRFKTATQILLTRLPHRD